MTTRIHHEGTRPGHAVLFATSVPLFLGTLLSDWAYSKAFVIQWANFASWLNAGALVIVGVALAWSIISTIFRRSTGGRGHWLYVLLVAAVFVLGFINSLVHAKDAWAMMPAGIILSVIVFLVAVVAALIGLSGRNRGVTP